MKYILLFIVTVMFIACSRDSSSGNCWDCEVQRMNGQMFDTSVCRNDNEAPQFQDAQGNDLNSFCTRQ